MPYIDIKEAVSQWQNNKYEPVYILAGEDAYLHENAVKQLEKSLNIDTLNREIFYGPDSSVNDIIIAAQTMPFIAEKRLIIVKEAQKIRQAETTKLVELFKIPGESSCLVLIWLEKLKKETRKTPLFAAVEKNGAIIEFKTLYERDIPSWIIKKAAEMKKMISPQAAEYLMRESGLSLMDINNELEKLFLFVGDKKEITLQDVEILSGHTKQANLYELSEAVESKNLKNAVEILETLLEEGEVPVIILSFIYTTVRKLTMAKSLLEDKGMREDEIAQKLRIHPYFSRRFFSNLRRFSKDELAGDLKLALNADLELKSSSRPENMIFEELLLGLSRNGGGNL
ncbi:MAG: DNA polymerase III subunit delta [Elusimicrobiota bacterium]